MTGSNTEVAQKALDHFGYLVIASEIDYPIGTVLDTNTSRFSSFDGQIVIASRATKEDFFKLCDYWECPRYIALGAEYFFKAKAE